MEDSSSLRIKNNSNFSVNEKVRTPGLGAMRLKNGEKTSF